MLACKCKVQYPGSPGATQTLVGLGAMPLVRELGVKRQIPSSENKISYVQYV